MILYYAVLYRQSNPTSQMGKAFEGKDIFCVFVAATSSAPQVAACPETICCLLADKLDVGCKSDVLDCICREVVPPSKGSVPAQTLLHGQGRVIPSCNMHKSRIFGALTVLQHSRGGSAIDRGMAKLCHFFMRLCFKWCSHWEGSYSQMEEGAERHQQSRKNPA